ncbi:hypothetical protein FKM82_020992 [Ascaphus truei]
MLSALSWLNLAPLSLSLSLSHPLLLALDSIGRGVSTKAALPFICIKQKKRAESSERMWLNGTYFAYDF